MNWDATCQSVTVIQLRAEQKLVTAPVRQLSGQAGGSVRLYDVRNMGGRSLNKLDLPRRERVNEVRWQPAAATIAAHQHQANARIHQSIAPTQAQVSICALMDCAM